METKEDRRARYTSFARAEYLKHMQDVKYVECRIENVELGEMYNRKLI